MKADKQPLELITFLQNQNIVLKEDIKNSQDLLNLNREALKIAIAPRKGQDQLPTLISLLFQENTKLLSRCNVLSQQLQSKSCQALISQQIASAYNEHEKYVASQLKDQLKLMKKDIQIKQNRIAELTKQLGKKQRREDTQTGEQITIIQYTDLTKISQKLFKEAENLRRQLQNRAVEIMRLKQQKDQLTKLNLILTRQLNQLKMIATSQSTVSQKRSFNTSSSDLSKFLKYQSKIADNSQRQSDQSNSSQGQQNSSNESNDHEQQFQQPQQNQKRQKLKPSLQFDKSKLQKLKQLKQNEKDVEKQLNQSKFEKNMKLVPKLQLKKAKEIQNIIVKKINQDYQKKKSGVVMKDDRAKRLQLQIEQLRKKLGNQIVIKLKIERENTFLKKFINELENRNQLLLRDKIQDNIQKNYEKQREQYRQDNVETILDICRDVTLNQKLRAVCKNKEIIKCKKNIQSKQI